MDEDFPKHLCEGKQQILKPLAGDSCYNLPRVEESNGSPENKKSTKLLVVVVVLVVLGMAGFLFSKTKTQSSNDLANVKSISGGPVKEFTVNGSSYKFDPETIVVNKGDIVKITFKDNDGRHNLGIDGYNLSTKIIGSGSEAQLQFVADKAGSFEFYCSVGSHKSLGMTGTFVVK
ncbi:MAG: cupredoxin domain-containing protein [Candidatus Woesebacteria bacterium]|nr:MAG: cupredoxin domain-containing protein [Candidatus Woesebacteria bacterium]